jgi:ATP-dependent DNA helicase DinG
LFTSRYALNNVYQELRKKPGSRDLPIFAQLRGSSRHAIIQGMHRTKNGILLGTNSFWEGIDLPGELLEILILAKLPFSVPSEPVIKAYSNLLQSLDKNPFLEFNVPESVIKFRQGFGRLIRTSRDVGAFFVMDERVVKKRYGTSFSDSIPVRMDPFSSLNEIRI